MAQTVEMDKEEVARRGKEIYERAIKDKVLADHKGELLSIDVLSGDYAVNQNHLATVDELRARQPEAVIFTLRVGYKTAYAMGGRMQEEA